MAGRLGGAHRLDDSARGKAPRTSDMPMYGHQMTGKCGTVSWNGERCYPGGWTIVIAVVVFVGLGRLAVPDQTFGRCL